MKTKNIAEFIETVDSHIAAGAVTQGRYRTDGFTITPDMTEEFGVPENLVRVLESIFEFLTVGDAVEFFRKIPRAIGVDGKDLTRVAWGFLASELAVIEHLDDCIPHVAAGMQLLADGKGWSPIPVMGYVYDSAGWNIRLREEIHPSVVAATTAASYATSAANGRCVCDFAKATYRAAIASDTDTRVRQRDTILRLLKSA